MSAPLYLQRVSIQEKRTWIYVVVSLAVPIVYFGLIAQRTRDTSVADVAYVRPMVTAVVVAIVANIVAGIAAAIASRDDVTDERDRRIDRFGDVIGFYVMSACAVVPLGLALTEAAYFWIANTLYASFVLAAVVSSAVKLIAYRRGI
jgi:hypothetical protein